MSCDCKEKLEERLLARFKELKPAATDHKVRLMGYAFIMTNELGLAVKGCMAVEQTAVLKPGAKKKNFGTNMMFTFCPFCGVKYDEPQLESAQ